MLAATIQANIEDNNSDLDRVWSESDIEYENGESRIRDEKNVCERISQ
jgi:hypothetical protein